ncbi:phosphoesterase [Haloarculaceae archaeon H-GB2-1]|nr:phosphoesterase [Haloarculaceae archaeon H-GB1-1]MEA5389339.1 phosphoesterase [Haloarculaceae archaeon H-GB11]MEA5409861.1 phosphoesterase [Haloarculaceae archaeon H-GB2-1]
MTTPLTVTDSLIRMFDALMRAYPYVFHPATTLGLGLLVLLYYEWRRQSASRTALWRRLGVLLGSGSIAFSPTVVYMIVTGNGLRATTKGNVWQVDWLVGGGILLAMAALWTVWTRFGWGALFSNGLEAVTAAMVPYLLLSPFWNVSGHVIIAVVPLLYLTLVDATFWPLLAIPVVMVPNRIYLDAHTWPQALGAFVLGAALTLVVYRHRNGDGQDLTPERRFSGL